MSDIEVKNLIVASATKYFFKIWFFLKPQWMRLQCIFIKQKGVLYYYFKSKEELFNEVLKQELDNVKLELKSIIDNNNDNDSLLTLKSYFFTRLKLLHKAVN